MVPAWLPVACPPTAQASSDPSAHTPSRSSVVLLGTVDHAEPSQCTIAPESPTLHTSWLALPETECRPVYIPTGLGEAIQRVPCQWMIVASRPTAHTSLAPDPHTLNRAIDVPLLGVVYAPDGSTRTIRPSRPTAHTVPAPSPHTARVLFWPSVLVHVAP